MRHFTYLIPTASLIFCSALLVAQPVVEFATSIPPFGTTYSRETHRLNFNVPQFPTTGGPIVWDLSIWNLQSFGLGDTAVFLDPSITPFAADFPLSTVSFHNYRIPTIGVPFMEWRYFAASQDSCGGMGFAHNIGPVQHIDPIVNNIPLPMSYQDSWISPDTSVVYSYSAYGTLIAPWGDTITDVIMLKYGLQNVPPWYEWYSADNIVDALGTYDPDFNVLDVDQRRAVSATHVNELAGLSVLVAPNPTSGMIQLRCPGITQGSVSLFDNSGRLVFQHTYRSDRPYLQLDGIEPGCYVLRVEDDTGRFGTARIVVH